MEFTPLKIFPQYVPIHRLSRFLHIASIPAAVVIGIVLATGMLVNNKIIKAILWECFSTARIFAVLVMGKSFFLPGLCAGSALGVAAG